MNNLIHLLVLFLYELLKLRWRWGWGEMAVCESQYANVPLGSLALGEGTDHWGVFFFFPCFLWVGFLWKFMFPRNVWKGVGYIQASFQPPNAYSSRGQLVFSNTLLKKNSEWVIESPIIILLGLAGWSNLQHSVDTVNLCSRSLHTNYWPLQSYCAYYNETLQRQALCL